MRPEEHHQSCKMSKHSFLCCPLLYLFKRNGNHSCFHDKISKLIYRRIILGTFFAFGCKWKRLFLDFCDNIVPLAFRGTPLQKRRRCSPSRLEGCKLLERKGITQESVGKIYTNAAYCISGNN